MGGSNKAKNLVEMTYESSQNSLNVLINETLAIFPHECTYCFAISGVCYHFEIGPTFMNSLRAAAAASSSLDH